MSGSALRIRERPRLRVTRAYAPYIVPPAPPATLVPIAVVRGPQGPAGAGAYTHVQGAASALWTVAHNLGVKPSVSILTVGGLEIAGGEVLHLSDNTLTISFDAAFAGSARCI